MLETQAHIAFHLTGKLPRGEVDARGQRQLYPAILAGYRDLTALRYDFPLVLVRSGDDGKPLQSLAELVDAALKNVAADADGERLKKHALRIERDPACELLGGLGEEGGDGIAAARATTGYYRIA